MNLLQAVLLAARLLLAGVFLLAGVTKLLDRPGSRRTLVDFGVPQFLAAPFSIVLPVVELTVACGLILQITALYGAIGSLVLLLVFMLGIGANLARGRTPDCHCFGQVHSAPVGWLTVARNGALAATAGFVILARGADTGPSLVAWLVPFTVLKGVGVLIVAIGIALVASRRAFFVQLVRQNRPASSEQPAAPARFGRPIGSLAPDFALENLDGETITLQALCDQGKPIVLFFSDPGCGPCRALLPDIDRWQRAHHNAVTFVLLSRGTPEINRAKFGDHGAAPVLLQRKREVAQAYDAVGTPSALVVLPTGTIGSRLARGDAEIKQLIAEWVHAEKKDETPLALAPGFMLPDLDGASVSLDQFRGKPTLVLFWNPGCGHCRRMLGDLKAWEARPLPERPHLLVVSTGTIDDNRALGLRSVTVLDPTSVVRQEYGLPGTPSAALVDADGNLLEKAVGASLILQLAGQSDEPRVVTLPPGAKPLRERCVRDELLSDGSMVLYNSCRRQVLTLNATAALVWECCDGEHLVEGIAAEMREVFPASDGAEGEVRELLHRLLQASMITASA